MNYVLLKYGYPPVIIKSSDKKEYLNALNKADVGDLEAFIEYIAKQLIWSIQLNIKAGKGESIEEPGDVDKEIELLSKELNPKNQQTPFKLPVHLINFFNESGKNFIRAYFEKLFKLMPTISYLEVSLHIEFPGNGMKSYDYKYPSFTLEHIIIDITNYLKENTQRVNLKSIERVTLGVNMKGIKNNIEKKFATETDISFSFSDYYYTLEFKGISKRKFYSEEITPEEITDLINSEFKRIISHLRESLKS
jgi:hypothetical protein